MIRIDSEFEKMNPPLTKEEFKQLEKNCIANGIDPLIVWNEILIDGHSRYKIAEKHNLPFSIREMFFASREDAKIWITKHQLGRRNLSDKQRAVLAARLNALMVAQNKKRKEEKKLGIVDDTQQKKIPKLREWCAKQFDIKENQVQKAAKLNKEEQDAILENCKSMKDIKKWAKGQSVYPNGRPIQIEMKNGRVRIGIGGLKISLIASEAKELKEKIERILN